jgi:hypothetical protein
MPRRPPRQEWEPSIPISVEWNGVIHNGRYQLESGRSENRMIRVTCGEGSIPPTRLGAMDPESFARGLLLEIVGKKTSSRRP